MLSSHRNIILIVSLYLQNKQRDFDVCESFLHPPTLNNHHPAFSNFPWLFVLLCPQLFPSCWLMLFTVTAGHSNAPKPGMLVANEPDLTLGRHKGESERRLYINHKHIHQNSFRGRGYVSAVFTARYAVVLEDTAHDDARGSWRSKPSVVLISLFLLSGSSEAEDQVFLLAAEETVSDSLLR